MHSAKGKFLGFVALLTALTVAATEPPCSNPDYQHGISYLLPLKYGADFTHFEWTNPDAPKTGTMRLPSLGTFDNYNNILEKGRMAAGFDVGGGLVYDKLLEGAADEPVSAYGRLAEGVAKGPDLDWVAFKLRDNAYWHDGEPITVDDVLFTFEMFLEHGSVAIRTALSDLERVFAFGEREVCFVRNMEREINPALPFAIGGYSILPKHYWATRDITKTTVEPPMGSGPYRLKRAETGRLLEFELDENYWGRDIPVNRGRYNFSRIKFDYFKDDGVMLEAHKSDVFDIREEGVSKNWATQYDFPAVRAGLFKRDLRKLTRVEGLWWPIFWNTEKPPLNDVRVREALWLLYDFGWTNRVLFYNFYSEGCEPVPELTHGTQRSAERKGTAVVGAVARAGAAAGLHGGFRSSAEHGLRSAAGPDQARARALQGSRVGDARRRHAQHRDGRAAEPELHRRVLLLHPAEPLADGQSRAGGYQGHGTVAGSLPVALPQPDGQVRRQLQPLGTGPYAGACLAQLVRQRIGRPGLRPELGANPRSGARQPDRVDHLREDRGGSVRGNARARPCLPVELLPDPTRLATGFPPGALGQVRRSAPG